MREGVRNIRKWGMTALWFSMSAKQQAVSTFNLAKQETQTTHSFKREKKWGWTTQRRPSLCAGQKRTYMTVKYKSETYCWTRKLTKED